VREADQADRLRLAFGKARNRFHKMLRNAGFFGLESPFK
jgi:hypothetical protein